MSNTGNIKQNYQVTINGQPIDPKPIYKQSQKIVPFCPFCSVELDQVDMINNWSECNCGMWSDNTIGKALYKNIEGNGYIYRKKGTSS